MDKTCTAGIDIIKSAFSDCLNILEPAVIPVIQEMHDGPKPEVKFNLHLCKKFVGVLGKRLYILIYRFIAFFSPQK